MNQYKNEIKQVNELKEKDDDFYLSEVDFYPPADNRFLQSYIEDIIYEDNFVEYAKYIYDLYEDEDWYEN